MARRLSLLLALSLVIGVLVGAACGGGGPASATPSGQNGASPPLPLSPTVSPSPPETPPTVPLTASPGPPAGSPAEGAFAVQRAFPLLAFERMVDLTPYQGGFLLVLQRGQVLFIADEREDEASLFLDIRDRVNDTGNEEGLLALAVDPQFEATRHVYVYYTTAQPRRSVLSRFTVGPDGLSADPDSEEVLLEVRQPFENHNGGTLLFGPDGYLYLGLGDGGGGGDPYGNGQNLGTLLGSIVRIDVRQPSPGTLYGIPPDNPFVGREGAQPEIYAYGLRNPWRMSFDRETGELWVGDVGEAAFEEIDVVRPGGNYGWNIMEGFHCYPADANCDPEGLELPLVEYDHSQGCSVTGGYVYRGQRLPALRGYYVYGDYCSGRIWALKADGSRNVLLLESGLLIPSFAEDSQGELLILSFDGGIYRLVAAGE